MAAMTFWEWVNQQAIENNEIFSVPDAKEFEIISLIEYICETAYFYGGSESWNVGEWDAHMEDYFVDIGYPELEITKRKIYQSFREKYLGYQASIKAMPKKIVSTPKPIRPKRSIPLSIRWRVLERDGRRCRVCGASPDTDPTVKLHVDHIVPVSRGGASMLDNLQTLCEACNLGKSNRMPS